MLFQISEETKKLVAETTQKVAEAENVKKRIDDFAVQYCEEKQIPFEAISEQVFYAKQIAVDSIFKNNAK